jgi:hypothetical protein
MTQPNTGRFEFGVTTLFILISLTALAAPFALGWGIHNGPELWTACVLVFWGSLAVAAGLALFRALKYRSRQNWFEFLFCVAVAAAVVLVYR